MLVCTQIHTITHKYTQINTNRNKYTQMKTNTQMTHFLAEACHVCFHILGFIRAGHFLEVDRGFSVQRPSLETLIQQMRRAAPGCSFVSIGSARCTGSQIERRLWLTFVLG